MYVSAYFISGIIYQSQEHVQNYMSKVKGHPSTLEVLFALVELACTFAICIQCETEAPLLRNVLIGSTQ